MMKFLLSLICLMFLVAPAFADCRLPEKQTLNIACTYKCGFDYRFRLNRIAKKLGLPLNIIDLNDAKTPFEAMTEIDGLLAPGGADIDPEYYLDNVDVELRNYTRANLNLVKFSSEGKTRDPFEFEVLTKYNEDSKYKKLPLLGICRGMQMMSVVQGLPLWLDIKTEIGIPNRRHKFDRIFVKPESSVMQDIYKNDDFLGYKIHHQGLRLPYYETHKEKYPKVRVSALSNDGKIAESIEYLHRPALGVQYHPEKSFSTATYPVFKWFLTKACEYKNGR